MSNILILGGAGFIGTYLARELLHRKHTITIVDNMSKYGDIQHAHHNDPRCTVIRRDVRSMYPAEFRGYDYVICLAALIGGIKYFHQIPYRIARDNTTILSHAIECTLASAPDAVFIYFSSSMIYERMYRPVSEADALEQLVPITNYGMQKLFGEFLVRGAHEEFGLSYLTVRPFNAVGSGELPSVTSKGHVQFGMAHVIPDFVYKALIKQTPFEIFGEGTQIRTFTHAEDIAVAVRLMIELGIRNDDFNVCGNITHDMNYLARSIWSAVNPGLDFPEVRSLPIPPSDVPYRVGISDKAHSLLGWTPRRDLAYVIKDTINFVRTHMVD